MMLLFKHNADIGMLAAMSLSPPRMFAGFHAALSRLV
jgi:hypothetical protein